MVGLFSDGTCTEWSEFGPCLPGSGLKGRRTVVKSCIGTGGETIKSFSFQPCVTSCSLVKKTPTAPIDENCKW